MFVCLKGKEHEEVTLSLLVYHIVLEWCSIRKNFVWETWEALGDKVHDVSG